MARTDPNAGLNEALSTFLWDAMSDGAQMGRGPFTRLVNRKTGQLVKAFRAVVKEQVRALPGRAQKGAVDAALRSVTPKVAKALRV